MLTRLNDTKLRLINICKGDKKLVERTRIQDAIQSAKLTWTSLPGDLQEHTASPQHSHLLK
ncbi:hypothetical protein E2C01_086559 [Portunus trituberculatus]|uniref:Uncharacterized protein n=1 Tax=Portunus trituberculatus TaxID=210409 RepID=A0A5B7JBT1_PORTR|nr:hypothetical protein [Portunus trituberculatus]